VDVVGNGIAKADTVEAQIIDRDGHAVGAPFSQAISADKSAVKLQSKISAPRLWTAETPNLYQVEVRLKHGATVIHQMRQSFGFPHDRNAPGRGGLCERATRVAEGVLSPLRSGRIRGGAPVRRSAATMCG